MRPPAALLPTAYEEALAPEAARPALHGTVRAQACVVGGGFAGLNAALHLARSGARTILLEAHRVGAGASGRNGGQVHRGYSADQMKLERLLGKAHARDLWTISEEAHAHLGALIETQAINCDRREGLIFAAWKPGDVNDLNAHAAYMQAEYGLACPLITRADMPKFVASERYFGGVSEPGGGHLDPLKLVRGLARAAEAAGVQIFESSAVQAIETSAGGITLRTAGGAVEAELCALATDTWLGALDRKAGAYALPINSFIGVTAPLGAERARALIPSGAAISDTKFVVEYYRVTPDHRLLFGGGETYGPSYPADLPAFMKRLILRVFPQLADVPVAHAWGGPVGVSLMRMPHAGRRGANLVFAHGFSGQGVVNANYLGKLMGEALLGPSDQFDTLMRLPHRAFPGGRLLRRPLMALGMAYAALHDRL